MAQVLHLESIAERLGISQRSLSAYLSANKDCGGPRPVRRGFYDYDEVVAFRERRREEGRERKRQWMLKHKPNSKARKAARQNTSAESAMEPLAERRVEILKAEAAEITNLPTPPISDPDPTVPPTVATPSAGTGECMATQSPTPAEALKLVELLERLATDIDPSVTPKPESDEVDSRPEAPSPAISLGLSSVKDAPEALPTPPRDLEHAVPPMVASNPGSLARSEPQIQAVTPDADSPSLIGGLGILAGGITLTFLSAAVEKVSAVIHQLRAIETEATRKGLHFRVAPRTLRARIGLLHVLLAGRDPVQEARSRLAKRVRRKKRLQRKTSRPRGKLPSKPNSKPKPPNTAKAPEVEDTETDWPDWEFPSTEGMPKPFEL